MNWITEQEYLETVEESRHKLIATARGYCVAEDDAEDAVQEAIMYCYKKLDEYDSEKASVITWVTNIVIGRARDLNYYRERELDGVIDPPDPEEEDSEEDQDSDFVMEGRSSSVEPSYTPDYDTKISVQQALSKLAPADRDVAISVLIEGRTEHEYAAMRGVSRPTVARQMAKIKSQLRELLREFNE